MTVHRKGSAVVFRGFTLVETLVAISIYTILLLVVTSSVQTLYKINGYEMAQSDEVDSARRGLVTWVRDAREMTFAEDGSFPLVVVENYRLGFYSDIDRDDYIEYVEYNLSSTTLVKRTYNPSGTPLTYSTTTPDQTETLSTFVQNRLQSQVMFSYSNASGTAIASPAASISDIRYVQMNLIVNIDPVRSPGEFMLQGSAAPRNLKESL